MVAAALCDGHRSNAPQSVEMDLSPRDRLVLVHLFRSKNGGLAE